MERPYPLRSPEMKQQGYSMQYLCVLHLGSRQDNTREELLAFVLSFKEAQESIVIPIRFSNKKCVCRLQLQIFALACVRSVPAAQG